MNPGRYGFWVRSYEVFSDTDLEESWSTFALVNFGDKTYAMSSSDGSLTRYPSGRT